jgi:hypothetical protein
MVQLEDVRPKELYPGSDNGLGEVLVLRIRDDGKVVAIRIVPRTFS